MFQNYEPPSIQHKSYSHTRDYFVSEKYASQNIGEPNDSTKVLYSLLMSQNNI